MKNCKEELEKLVEKVKLYPEVIAIFIFGSYAKGLEKPLSDIDIAVILKDRISKKLESDIGSMYSEKIDLVLFHRLPLHIQFEIFKYGKEIFCRDREALLEIKRKVLRDYLEMAEMYARIKKRIVTCE
jgi:predicted nucleotidyltransferase